MLRLARQRPEDLLHFLTLPCCPEPSRARTPESVAWLPHDVAVRREFSFQGPPMCICRSGGTASPPDLLDSNTSTCIHLAVKPPPSINFQTLWSRLTNRRFESPFCPGRPPVLRHGWCVQNKTAYEGQESPPYVHTSWRYLWRIFSGLTTFDWWGPILRVHTVGLATTGIDVHYTTIIHGQPIWPWVC